MEDKKNEIYAENKIGGAELEQVKENLMNFDDIQLNGVDGLNKVEDSEQYVKKEDVSKAFDDPEQRKKFIKNLNPKVKAGLVFEMLSRSGQIRVFGHNKRIYLRKLEREAAKGRLDYLFEEKREEKRDK